MKVLPLGAQLFNADRRTEMKKLTVAFRNFANAPKHRTSYVDEKPRGCNSSPHTTWLMTSWNMIWRGNVSRDRERRRACGLLAGKRKGKDATCWTIQAQMGRIILRWILTKWKEKWIKLAQDRRKWRVTLVWERILGLHEARSVSGLGEERKKDSAPGRQIIVRLVRVSQLALPLKAIQQSQPRTSTALVLTNSTVRLN